MSNYNLTANVQKALNSLKGILIGITADEKLNQDELLFLDVWIKSQRYLKNDNAVVDLLDLLDDILKNEVITQRELAELNESILDIIQIKSTYNKTSKAKVNEFIGLLSGISADGEINKKEVIRLSKWIMLNHNVKDIHPINVIHDMLFNAMTFMLSEGELKPDIHDEFLRVISEVTGQNFLDTGSTEAEPTSIFNDDINFINYEEACFCFTGKFESGSRKTIEAHVKDKGSETRKDVSGTVDYLVIGTHSSEDWKFSSHGRKIEKAIKMKEEGSSIKIISEKEWLKYA